MLINQETVRLRPERFMTLIAAASTISPAFRSLIVVISILGNGLVCSQTNSELPRIAHAGGKIANATYTNSIDALDTNYQMGFRVFEMDFSWTTDQQLVCLHDWEESFERSFRRPPQGAVSLKEFEQLVEDRSEFTKCSLPSLVQWFSDHQDAILVTDVKERNLDALELISSNYPEFIDRVVPQIYQPDEYPLVRRLGYEKIIWTLYTYPGSNLMVVQIAQTLDLMAVTMDTVRARQRLGADLDAINMPSYVHTINDYADSLFFRSIGIDEIYTDELSLRREQSLSANNDVSISDSQFYQAEANKLRELTASKTRFFDKPRIHYSLANDYSKAQTSSNQIIFQGYQSGTLRLTATGNDPYINFPALAIPGKDVEIYIHLQVPDSSRLEIFYATQAQPNFSEAKKLSEITLRGSNEMVIKIEDANPITRLRLDPGTLPGEYSITRFEIRSN